MEKVLEHFVPRHIRLGVSCKTPEITDYHEVLEQIPVVDGDSVVYTESRVSSVPAVEDMSQYKLSAFRLSSLVKAGVPLSVVNINKSNAATIDDLEKVCRNIDDADKFVCRCLAQKAEKESWFREFDENQQVEQNEIY